MEPMLEMFIFESAQLLEQLEQTILAVEKKQDLESMDIDEIFRIMHTIKGSAAMMMFDNISSLTHSVEDLFFYIRESSPENLDQSIVCDMVLSSIDFIKNEIAKLEKDLTADGDCTLLMNNIKEHLKTIKTEQTDRLPDVNVALTAAVDKKYSISTSNRLSEGPANRYQVVLCFTPDCEMESIRAFSIIHSLKNEADIEEYIPADILENKASSEFIRANGFALTFTSLLSPEEVQDRLLKDPFVDTLDLRVIDNQTSEPSLTNPGLQIILEDHEKQICHTGNISQEPDQGLHLTNSRQSMISVNVHKLDMLMDMVGELVISESMVALNPDLATASHLDNFSKAARQHRKIINELQDIVMSIRMVPLSMTFQKMNRIVRDMKKKLDKDVVLEIVGEETEVDKNIIEHLSDPLMHLIRNAIDHGIESREERFRLGKEPVATVRLEAKNEGSDVYIIISDDGAGLCRDKILARARSRGLLQTTDNELSDGEIYSAILLPGFSTCDRVSEFSGRGVGMDVVARNIEGVGGTVLVDSKPGQGTKVTLKIPLTLTIINGMQIKVGATIYIIPITSIRETFKVLPNHILTDPDGHEMVMVRGQCYPVIRLCQHFKVDSQVQNIDDGIIIMVENNADTICLFADALLGEHQIVVKPLPKFIGTIRGLSGCTLLGDGKASLILDVASMVGPGR